MPCDLIHIFHTDLRRLVAGALVLSCRVTTLHSLCINRSCHLQHVGIQIQRSIRVAEQPQRMAGSGKHFAVRCLLPSGSQREEPLLSRSHESPRFVLEDTIAGLSPVQRKLQVSASGHSRVVLQNDVTKRDGRECRMSVGSESRGSHRRQQQRTVSSFDNIPAPQVVGVISE